MAVKDKLTELFEQNRGKYLSGEEIAKTLGCSRNAVWKSVKGLQESGYKISAVTNKGYCLEEDTDVISETGIKKYLNDKSKELDIKVYRQLESTNLTLRDFANNGAGQGLVVISGEQTKGRGRLGRSFFSPSDTGLYMSILLRPEMIARDAVKITTAAAVSVAEAVEKVSSLETKIKWVNDIYLNNKKICGILTEASFNMEMGGLEYAVLGIGVNAYEPENGFPDDIKNVAGAVFTKRENDIRNRLAGEILNSFSKYYAELNDNTFYDGYKSRLMWIGEKINLISAGKSTPATLLDVDKDCRIICEYENGEKGLISSGEISIRKKAD